MSEHVEIMSDAEWVDEDHRVRRSIGIDNDRPYSCCIKCPSAREALDRNCAFKDTMGLRRFNECPFPIMVVRRYIRERKFGLTKTKW